MDKQPKGSGWSWVSALCAMYFFGAFFVFYLATFTHNGALMGLVVLSWVVNLWLLRYANKKW